ncbi:alpha/beta hydrolase [Nocardia sp. NBC_01377]|uniref:alpha/beta hydrolase n=1 Tax=Nocardia sp. NBC_01377 TaxID=2903595 RepID=UPI003246518B
MHVTETMIDPGLRRAAAVLGRAAGRARTVDELRKPTPIMDRIARAVPIGGIRRRERWIRRRDGSPLRVLIVTGPDPAPEAAGILWIHGGGYAMGAPEWEIAAMRRLVRTGNCVIVSPDYRLSRLAPYPAAFEDCYDALLWSRDHADELGVRTDRLAVGGASAGGGLTAAVSLYARDHGEVAIAFQMPIYPMIDDRGGTDSAVDNNAPVWDAVTNESAWRLYLGDLYGGNVPAYAAPARAADFAGLPPTISFVGGIEPFRDETIAYVDALRAAGVPVEFQLFPGAFHGFDAAVWTPIAKRATAFLLDRFDHALRTHRAPQP